MHNEEKGMYKRNKYDNFSKTNGFVLMHIAVYKHKLY